MGLAGVDSGSLEGLEGGGGDGWKGLIWVVATPWMQSFQGERCTLKPQHSSSGSTKQPKVTQPGPAQACVSPEISPRLPQHAASKPWTLNLKNDSEWTTHDPHRTPALLDCEPSREAGISIGLAE